jgi:3-(3-hydroxy-phenyl)propionate hydroxylase
VCPSRRSHAWPDNRTATTELVYRHELRPVITAGAEVMDRILSRREEVVIAGGGPTGLMLAGEPSLAGAGVVIVERRTSRDLPGQRAGGLHSRTIEILDQRGIADRFLAEGQVAQIVGFGWIRMDMSDFPSGHPYGLALWRNHIERIRASWLSELKVPVYSGSEVTGFTQDEAGVDVEVSDGQPLRARYLAGCDGGRSLVRKAAGIGFTGWDAETRLLIAEAEMDTEPDLGLRRDARGLHALSRTQDGRRIRVMVPDLRGGAPGEPTLGDLSQAITAVYGTDFGLRGATWISGFTDAARQAESYRDRRVLLGAALADAPARTVPPAFPAAIGLVVLPVSVHAFPLGASSRPSAPRRA